MAGTAQAHQAGGKRQRKQADKNEIQGLGPGLTVLAPRLGARGPASSGEDRTAVTEIRDGGISFSPCARTGGREYGTGEIISASPNHASQRSEDRIHNVSAIARTLDPFISEAPRGPIDGGEQPEHVADAGHALDLVGIHLGPCGSDRGHVGMHG
jgi:hypothetical protein